MEKNNNLSVPSNEFTKEYSIKKNINYGNSSYYLYGGYDKNGIRYQVNEDILEIIIPNINQDYSYLNEAIEYYSKNNNKVIIKFDTNFDIFNNICKVLSNNKSYKNIILDISNIFYLDNLNKDTFLDFESLPNNVYVTYLNILVGKENDYLQSFDEQSSFETWALWLDEKKYNNVIKKLTYKSRKRISLLKLIVKEFYNENCLKLIGKTDLECSDMIFDWCKNNIDYYNTFEINNALYNDSIETLINKKGTSIGRARLFKNLLNNKYIKVDCYLVNGQKFNMGHEWNVVLIDDEKLYYDLNSQLKGQKNIVDYGYWDINIEQGIDKKEKNYYKQKTV